MQCYRCIILKNCLFKPVALWLLGNMITSEYMMRMRTFRGSGVHVYQVCLVSS